MILKGTLLTFVLTVVTTTMCNIIPDIHSDPPSSLRATLRKFSRPRHHVTNAGGKDKTRKFIRKMFRKSGLHVWSEYIDSYSTLRGENIVGMLRGKNTGTADDRIVVVGAHYDTTSRTRGVDDNGSGVTALLQAAKQIGKASCRFKNTVLFVAFDFEEDTAESEHPIPFGSQWFVHNLTEYLRKTGGTVKGALVLEMLANHNKSRGSQRFPQWFSFISPQVYEDITLDDKRGNFLAVIGRKDTDKALLEPLKKHYQNDKNFKVQLVPIPLSGRPSKSPYYSHLRDFFRSDHYNFWENSVSFPAVMVTDTSNFRGIMERCYHSKCDSMRLIDKNDLEFLRRNINAVIGTTIELSEAESCQSKHNHSIKAGLSTSIKTAELISEISRADTSKTDLTKTKVFRRNKILPRNISQAVAYSTVLILLLTLINSTFL